jgi:hypothetical protein
MLRLGIGRYLLGLVRHWISRYPVKLRHTPPFSIGEKNLMDLIFQVRAAAFVSTACANGGRLSLKKSGRHSSCDRAIPLELPAPI